jgi:DNA-nicking Smr family endonuclease
MPRPKRKNKQKSARLPKEINPGEVFGADANSQPRFVDEIAARLSETDLRKVLAEKKGKKPAPPSLQEILRHFPPPQETLDLHGVIGAEAEARVIGFLNASNALKHRTVRIITGKGLHTEGPAVLPPLVEIALSELKRSGRILHYAWDKKRRERSGSVVVYLE